MRDDHFDTEPHRATDPDSGPAPPSGSPPIAASGATGPNPLSEPVPNFPPDVGPNPAAPAHVDVDRADLADLERRLHEALSRAERGTELLEEAIRNRRQRR